jgi:hypothetical protein
VSWGHFQVTIEFTRGPDSNSTNVKRQTLFLSTAPHLRNNTTKKFFLFMTATSNTYIGEVELESRPRVERKRRPQMKRREVAW